MKIEGKCQLQWNNENKTMNCCTISSFVHALIHSFIKNIILKLRRKITKFYIAEDQKRSEKITVSY